jgi:hypothetical protein
MDGFVGVALSYLGVPRVVVAYGDCYVPFSGRSGTDLRCLAGTDSSVR